MKMPFLLLSISVQGRNSSKAMFKETKFAIKGSVNNGALSCSNAAQTLAWGTTLIGMRNGGSST
jgi:hypothetical protein